MNDVIVAGSGGGCFRAGTQVQLEGGKTISIEKIAVGDSVIAFDEHGNLHLAKVLKVHYHADPQPIMRVKYWRGEMSGVTPNHWVVNQYDAFAEIGRLTSEDALVDGMGHLRPIISAEIIGFEPVWNLTVETHHTFIADGIRVHNGGHRERFPVVTGSGGGGSRKGGGRAPREAPDTLQSKAMVSILDLIGEGRIGGLVDGAKSIFFDDTPLVSAAGTSNFGGVTWEAREGTPDQLPIQGFGQIETPYNISVKVTKNSPVVGTITNPNADRVRCVITIPSLWKQDMNTGDVNGTSVSYSFEVSVNGGPYSVLEAFTLKGKSRSRYQRSHTFALPKTGPGGIPATVWSIRMLRLTDDSTSQALSNETWFDTYVEIVDSKLSYPNSALVGVTIDSEQFSHIPTRSYLVKGLYVQVPQNYDPATRTYSGVWSGAFKIAITSNPAWILYDLLTNERYGLGRWIKPNMVNKAALYQIGKYCDEPVPDGFGGTEPRFRINTAIQAQGEAYKLIADICSVFRGMAFWSGSMVGFMQDSPTDPSMIYSQANVVDGMFNYTGSAKKDRYTVVLVQWNDPDRNYKRMIEYVEDEELVSRFGVRKVETIAFGCTSRGQAHRVGKWMLYTQRYSEMVSFKVGVDSMMVVPGEVIKINDPWRGGARFGGRLKSATLNTATLDSPVEITGAGAKVAFVMPDGGLEERTINEDSGSCDVVSWSDPLPEVPLVNAMWSMSDPTLQPMLARIVNIVQDSATQFTITAVEHHPQKYASVEYDVKLDPINLTRIPSRPPRVTNVVAVTELYRLNSAAFSARIAVSWTLPATASSAVVEWRRDGENYKQAEVSGVGYDIENVPAGTYTIRVFAKNALGISGESVTVTHEVESSGTAPDVQNLRMNPSFAGKDLPIAWDEVPSATAYIIEIRDAGTNALIRTEQTSLASYTYTYAKNASDGGPRRSLKVAIKAVTLIGESANWTAATFSNPAPEAPSGVAVEAGPGQVGISAMRPTDDDLAGMIVWMSQDPEVPMTSGNLIYQGTDNAYMKTGLQPGVTVYFRVAFYDHFGTDGIIPSSSVSATPTATGGVVVVQELPASPNDIDGELAVFLDVPDVTVRGLYGWDGSEWIRTNSLLDGSVTTDKLAPEAVDFTKLAVGAVQAKNLALKKHFIY